MALTRLAYACPMCRQVILINGALEKAQEISKKIHYKYPSELIQWLAKFLAVICYRDLPDHKVIFWSIFLWFFPCQAIHNNPMHLLTTLIIGRSR